MKISSSMLYPKRWARPPPLRQMFLFFFGISDLYKVRCAQKFYTWIQTLNQMDGSCFLPGIFYSHTGCGGG